MKNNTILVYLAKLKRNLDNLSFIIYFIKEK